MNAVWLIAAALAPLSTGWFVVRALWPMEPARRELGSTVLRVGLAVAVGYAIAAIHYFAWRALSATGPGLAYKLLDCVALPALAFLAAKRLGAPGAVVLAPTPAVTFRWRNWQGAMLLATLAVVALALVTMAGRAWYEAYGYWDGWAIWNLKARFMFRGGPEWSGFFSRHAWYAHPDYPLLVPASVARLWTYLGDDAAVVPQLFSVGSAALMLVLVFGVVATLRGVPAGCLAALVVAGAERVLFYGGSQMADIALAAFVTGGTGLIAIAGRAERGAVRLFVLAGILIGFSTFVKNEGLMLAPCVIAALVIATPLGRKAAAGVRWPALALLVGMVPGLLTVASQKTAFPADLYMLHDQESSFREKAGDGSRHAKILGFIVRTDFGTATRAVGPVEQMLPNKPMLWLLLLLPIVGGVACKGRDRFAAATCGTFLALAFAGYYAALLLMPYDLAGNLEFGFDRVQLHIYTTLVMTIMLLTRRLPASVVP